MWSVGLSTLFFGILFGYIEIIFDSRLTVYLIICYNNCKYLKLKYYGTTIFNQHNFYVVLLTLPRGSLELFNHETRLRPGPRFFKILLCMANWINLILLDLSYGPGLDLIHQNREYITVHEYNFQRNVKVVTLSSFIILI